MEDAGCNHFGLLHIYEFETPSKQIVSPVMARYTDSLLSHSELLHMSAWYARESNALLDPGEFLFCLAAMF